MAIYKATYCYPLLDSLDIRVVANAEEVSPCLWFKCRVDSSNKIVTGYKIRLLDGKNNQVFPVTNNGMGYVSPISELASVISRDYINSGLNGSMLHIPFFQNHNYSNAPLYNNMVLPSYNAIYYHPCFKVDYVAGVSGDTDDPITAWTVSTTPSGEKILSREGWDGKINGEVVLKGETILFLGSYNTTNYRCGIWKVNENGTLSQYKDAAGDWITNNTTDGQLIGHDIVITHGIYHNVIYRCAANGSYTKLSTALGEWTDIEGNAIDLDIEGGSYKWEITLYQGRIEPNTHHITISVSGEDYGLDIPYLDYTSLDYTWFDSVLNSGTILGSTNKRIQIASSLADDAVLPSGTINNPLVLQGKYVQLFDSEGAKVAKRAYVQNYDSSFGHVYPITGGIQLDWIKQAERVAFYKHSNNAEDVLANEKVSVATTEHLNLYTTTEVYTRASSFVSGTTYYNYNNNTKQYYVADPQPTAETFSQEPRYTKSVKDIFNPNIGLPPIDGWNLSEGDLVLVKDQKNSKENGIYVAHGSGVPWSRSGSYKSWGNFIGAIIFVCNGDQNGGTNWESLAQAGGTLFDTSVTSGDSPLDFIEEKPLVLFADSIDRAVDLVRQWSPGGTATGPYYTVSLAPSSAKSDGIPFSPGQLIYCYGNRRIMEVTDVVYQKHDGFNVLQTEGGSTYETFRDTNKYNKIGTISQSSFVANKYYYLNNGHYTLATSWTEDLVYYTRELEYVGKIAESAFEANRYYTLQGSASNGVYTLANSWSASAVYYQMQQFNSVDEAQPATATTADTWVITWRWADTENRVQIGEIIQVANGRQYGGKVVRVFNNYVEVTDDFNYAYIQKNTTYYTYISPFVGLREGMALKLLNNKTITYAGGESSKWIRIKTNFTGQAINTVLWRVRHDIFLNPLESANAHDTSIPYEYEVRTFFRTSDENPFNLYEAPYLKLSDGNSGYTNLMTYQPYQVESISGDLDYLVTNDGGIPYLVAQPSLTAIATRYVTLQGFYYQYQQASWESYRWVLMNYNGEIVQDTGLKYDKEMKVTFYGLSNELENNANRYFAVLYVTDSLGNNLSFTMQLIVDAASLSSANIKFSAEFDCSTQSILLNYQDNVYVAPSVDVTSLHTTYRYDSENSVALAVSNMTWDDSYYTADGLLNIQDVGNIYDIPLENIYTTNIKERSGLSESVINGLSYSHYFLAGEQTTEPEIQNLIVEDNSAYFETEVILNDNYCGQIMELQLEGMVDGSAVKIQLGLPDNFIEVDGDKEYDIEHLNPDRNKISLLLVGQNADSTTNILDGGYLRSTSDEDYFEAFDASTYVEATEKFVLQPATVAVEELNEYHAFEPTVDGQKARLWYKPVRDPNTGKIRAYLNSQLPLGNGGLVGSGVQEAGPGYWAEDRGALVYYTGGLLTNGVAGINLTTSNNALSADNVANAPYWPTEANGDNYVWLERSDLETYPNDWAKINGETGDTLTLWKPVPRHPEKLNSKTFRIIIRVHNIDNLYLGSLIPSAVSHPISFAYLSDGVTGIQYYNQTVASVEIQQLTE